MVDPKEIHGFAPEADLRLFASITPRLRAIGESRWSVGANSQRQRTAV